jgi:hypothetical protein
VQLGFTFHLYDHDFSCFWAFVLSIFFAFGLFQMIVDCGIVEGIKMQHLNAFGKIIENAKMHNFFTSFGTFFFFFFLNNCMVLFTTIV